MAPQKDLKLVNYDSAPTAAAGAHLETKMSPIRPQQRASNINTQRSVRAACSSLCSCAPPQPLITTRNLCSTRREGKFPAFAMSRRQKPAIGQGNFASANNSTRCRHTCSTPQAHFHPGRMTKDEVSARLMGRAQSMAEQSAEHHTWRACAENFGLIFVTD